MLLAVGATMFWDVGLLVHLVALAASVAVTVAVLTSITLWAGSSTSGRWRCTSRYAAPVSALLALGVGCSRVRLVLVPGWGSVSPCGAACQRTAGSGLPGDG